MMCRSVLSSLKASNPCTVPFSLSITSELEVYVSAYLSNGRPHDHESHAPYPARHAVLPMLLECPASTRLLKCNAKATNIVDLMLQ
jgi:hypothetical protein